MVLYIVDISSFIFRAFYAIRPLHTPAGEPVNAVFGVASMLARLVDEANPTHLVVTYDSKEPSFRKEIYAEYKANRAAPPEDLIPQFDRIEQLVARMGIAAFRKSGVEADDLIATLTHQWLHRSPRNRVVIVTGDKDLFQLVDDRVEVWDTMNGKRYTPKEVEEKLGVPPSQVRDYLALVGDSSDNIPGVAGIGPKTAVDLLKEHGSLKGVLAAAEKSAIAGKRGETLKASTGVARLSYDLATVKHDVKLDREISESEFGYRFRVEPDCEEFLREMQFNTLLAKWKERAASNAGAGGAAASVVVSADDRFRAVTTEGEFEKVIHGIEKAGEFGFDLETTGLNPRAAEIVGVAICHDPAFGVYIPVGHEEGRQLPREQVLRRLKPYLENPQFKKIGQNLKFDFSVLAEQGIQADGIGADTMVADYVLDADGRHNLETLARKHLDYKVLTYAEVCGEGKNEIPFARLPIETATRYSAEDAWLAVRLWRELHRKLDQERLMEVYSTIDLPLVSILSKMERAGVCVDVDWLSGLASEFQKDLAKIEKKISSFSKNDGDPINLNSPRQIAKLLFEDLGLPTKGKTKTGFSTDAQVLSELAAEHEVPALILEYREIAKLLGTYVEPLPALRDPKTGKIHASFHQAVTATGRLSSSDPNLQNIPIRSERGRKIRRAFVPSPGNVLVAADYSQIELRILAHVSGDAELVRSFKADEDVHRRTASEIFSVAPEKVDDRQRGIAKAINFGLMYGKTPFGLSQELRIPRKEAQEIIDRYFVRYSGVKAYFDRTIARAREEGFVRTWFGRRRNLPDLASKNPAVRNNAERMAMNTPIQGTAADLMKLAMIRLDEALEKGGFRSRLIIQVHDEVVLDCPRAEAAMVERLVVEALEGAADFAVPLKVNAATGESWAEL